MPGLVGFTCAGSAEADRNALRAMRDLITHRTFYATDELFHDGEVAASRAHIDVIQRDPQPLRRDGIAVWLDGEFHNRDALGLPSGIGNDAEALASLYADSPDLGFLGRIDGVFAAVIHDPARRRVHLVSDRHGLCHLYWTVQGGRLAWASEIKAFTAVPGFRPRIDAALVDGFLEHGFMTGAGTWFEDVTLIPLAAVVTWDLGSRRHQVSRYWRFDDIVPLEPPVDERAIAEELGRRFKASVQRRCRNGEDIGITLSGGLDSRAIFAAMPDTGKPIPALTFGAPGSADLRIARRVARIRETEHTVFELSERNWLAARIEGVWLSDGMMNLLHMHGLERFVQSRKPPINLNGFLGGAFMGGRYLQHSQWPLAELYQDRARRFVVLGPRLGQAFIHQRLPYLDNELVDFILAVPDALRARSNIFNKMLLQCFPAYFRHIPWTETRVPIAYPRYIAAPLRAAKRLRNRIGIESRRLGFQYHDPNAYHDYPQWIRRQPARSFFTDRLQARDALYPEFIDRERVVGALDAHMHGADHADPLCRYLTFELFLQQTFNGRHRRREDDQNSAPASGPAPVGT